MNARVSVVVPMFNAGAYVKETIKSVLRQSFRDFEIVIVDDGSTDNCFELAESMANMDNRITLIKLKENSGVIVARNKAIEAAEGEFIVPLDADDIIGENFIERCYDFLCKNENFSVVYTLTEITGSKCGEFFLPEYCPTLMTKRNLVPNTALFRKKDWEKYGGYNSNMNYGLEDWDFWLNFVEDGKLFYRIPEKLFFYRQHEANAGSRNSDLAANAERLAKMYVQIWKNHPSLYRQTPNWLAFRKQVTYGVLFGLSLGLSSHLKKKMKVYSIYAEYERFLKRQASFGS